MLVTLLDAITTRESTASIVGIAISRATYVGTARLAYVTSPGLKANTHDVKIINKVVTATQKENT